MRSASSENHRPDFLVWVDGYVIAINSKCDHLINEDAGRKVFSSDKMEDGGGAGYPAGTEGRWQASPTYTAS